MMCHQMCQGSGGPLGPHHSYWRGSSAEEPQNVYTSLTLIITSVFLVSLFPVTVDRVALTCFLIVWFWVRYEAARFMIGI